MKDVTDIATPDLVTETAVDGTQIKARLVGCAERITREDLATYLEAIDQLALEADASEVVLDIRSLDFISAGCLRSLLAWITENVNRGTREMRVVWDVRQPWQHRSLRNVVSPRGVPIRFD